MLRQITQMEVMMRNVRKSVKYVMVLVMVSFCALGCLPPKEEKQVPQQIDKTPTTIPLQDMANAPKSMTLTSEHFKDGGKLALRHAFNQFGCVGENAPPSLKWSGAPKGTKSFALIVHDPDAPTGVGFFHWVVVNIPASIEHLGAKVPENALQLHTDYGQSGYGGPCPPKGRNHRYVFRVYALKVPKLEVPKGATGALIRFLLREHSLAMGQMVGTFSRK